MGSSSLRNLLIIAGAVFIGGWVALALTLFFTYQVMPALLTSGSREWRVSAVMVASVVVPYLVGGITIGVLSGRAEPRITPLAFLLGAFGCVLVWLYTPELLTLGVHGKFGRSAWRPVGECAIVIGGAFVAFKLSRRSRQRPAA